MRTAWHAYAALGSAFLPPRRFAWLYANTPASARAVPAPHSQASAHGLQVRGRVGMRACRVRTWGCLLSAPLHEHPPCVRTYGVLCGHRVAEDKDRGHDDHHALDTVPDGVRDRRHALQDHVRHLRAEAAHTDAGCG